MSLFIYFSICENYCTLSEPPVSLCFHMINMAEDGEVLTNVAYIFKNPKARKIAIYVSRVLGLV